MWAVWAHPELHLPGAPERAGWFGTDRNGYDVFSRVIFGARISLAIGVLAITFGLLIGGTLGLLAGYYRGWIDRFTDNGMNVMLAFPALLLAIFVVTFFNTPNATAQANTRPIWPIILALSLLSIPPLTRLVRANTFIYAQREFVHGGPERRRQREAGAVPGDPPQRRPVDDLLRPHRTGAAHRGRGRPGLPRPLRAGARPRRGER